MNTAAGENPPPAPRLRTLVIILVAWLVWLVVYALFAWWASGVVMEQHEGLALLAMLVGSISTALVIMSTVDLDLPTGLCLVLFLAFCAVIFFADDLVEKAYVGALITNTALIGAAFALGRALANRIPENGFLIPVVIVLTLVDLWSVFAAQGLSRQIVEEQPEVLNQVALRYPTPGHPDAGEAPPPILGGMDFCFMALLLPAAKRFRIGASRVFFGLIAALVACILVLYLTKVPLPYAPFMAVGFVAAGWGRLELNRRYLTQTAMFVGVLLVVFLLLHVFAPAPEAENAVRGLGTSFTRCS